MKYKAVHYEITEYLYEGDKPDVEKGLKRVNDTIAQLELPLTSEVMNVEDMARMVKNIYIIVHGEPEDIAMFKLASAQS